MPPSKPKPSEIAAEAKKTYIPYIRNNLYAEYPATSVLCVSEYMNPLPIFQPQHLRFAFYDRDPVDVALEWESGFDGKKIPVIMPANDKRPGGDWEAGVMSLEECLCRRSNLYGTITTPDAKSSQPSNYPIPPTAGIFSEKVVVFRSGPEKYEVWPAMKDLPIISVCPVKRPKLDSSHTKYSFKQEKELMRDKIKCALRVAAWYNYYDLVISSFGLGPGFRNPTEEVAIMWRDALMKDPEFEGRFGNVVFAFENLESPSTSSSSSKGASSKSSSSKGSSSKSSSSSSSSSKSDLDVFRDVFKPSTIHGAFKEHR